MTRIIDRLTSDGAEEQAKNVRPDQPKDWKHPRRTGWAFGRELDRGKEMDSYLGAISPRKGKNK